MSHENDAPAPAAQPETPEPQPPAEPAGPPAWPAEDDPAHVAARNDRLAELRQRYPNQYVVYRDEWDGTRLVEPFFLMASADYLEVHRAVEAMPPEQAARLTSRFMLPPFYAKLAPLWAVARRPHLEGRTGE